MRIDKTTNNFRRCSRVSSRNWAVSTSLQFPAINRKHNYRLFAQMKLIRRVACAIANVSQAEIVFKNIHAPEECRAV